MIYFDHNATTPIDERVLEAMLPFLTRLYGNPSSLYSLGRVVRSAIHTAREQVASLVNTVPEQVIFTSGGSEANNLALKGCQLHAQIVSSAIEHPSVLTVNKRVHLVTVNHLGYVDIEVLKAIDNNIFDIASFMLVNNETGVIQNIAKIAQIIKSKGLIMHTDAVQAIGKIKVDFAALGVDLMSLSSHKIYGPKGCGALIVKNDVIHFPQIIGGEQEMNLRAGTENVAAIVGFGQAAVLAKSELVIRQQHCERLKQRLETHLKTISGISIFAEHSQRVNNTVQFSVESCVGEMLLMQLDKHQIAVSSGSACASANDTVSHVLTAMNISYKEAQSAVRVSFGQQNTAEEVDYFVNVLKKYVSIKG